ncbi:MAG: putative integrase [Candidatus Aramenus sulfurataquae]|uniref:Integrase n=1 Tax=Candidatus Aramenus sulfurataquae TaxID=1326980 RepID=A0ACC6TLF9_9CREN
MINTRKCRYYANELENVDGKVKETYAGH